MHSFLLEIGAKAFISILLLCVASSEGSGEIAYYISDKYQNLMH